MKPNMNAKTTTEMNMAEIEYINEHDMSTKTKSKMNKNTKINTNMYTNIHSKTNTKVNAKLNTKNVYKNQYTKIKSLMHIFLQVYAE